MYDCFSKVCTMVISKIIFDWEIYLTLRLILFQFFCEYLKLKNFEYLTNCMTNSKMSIYICCLFKNTISLGYSCSFFTKLKLFFFFGNQLHYYSQSCNAFVAHYRHACSMTKKQFLEQASEATTSHMKNTVCSNQKLT